MVRTHSISTYIDILRIQRISCGLPIELVYVVYL
jgi:hypothetical protein